ncbi:ATP12-domain-containing protein, partial [Hymenopellis radicata]
MLSRSTRCVQRFRSLRRLQSTVAEIDGPAVTETNRAEATLKRFWKTVGIESRDGNLAVTLDKRALKTPEGHTLLLPSHKRLLATLVAAEWEHQETVIKHHALPVTSIVCRAIDAFDDTQTREEVCQALLEYLDTDTICFHEDYPDQLVALQTKHWDPILKWAKETFNVEIKLFDSILSNSHPNETKQKMLDVLRQMNKWELAAMERATYTLALVKEFITVEEASNASRVEVSSQIERWGEVEDTHDVDHFDIRRQLGSVSALCHDI